jgi:ubiquinone biosynthesis protein Coq4
MFQQFTFQDFYSEKINNLTLQEALDLHYQLNPQFTPWYKYSSEQAKNLIKSHDISHIIFGCDTSYSGEYTVQTWVKYVANLNIPKLQIFKYLFNKDLIKIVLPSKLISYSVSHISDFQKIKKQVQKQAGLITKKWYYFNEEKYLNSTIGQIREEYGIQILPRITK